MSLNFNTTVDKNIQTAPTTCGPWSPMWPLLRSENYIVAEGFWTLLLQNTPPEMPTLCSYRKSVLDRDERLGTPRSFDFSPPCTVWVLNKFMTFDHPRFLNYHQFHQVVGEYEANDDVMNGSKLLWNIYYYKRELDYLESSTQYSYIADFRAHYWLWEMDKNNKIMDYDIYND